MDNADVLRARFGAHPYLLAPMAGVTDAAYRIMCRRRGATMAYSEMVSVAGLAYASEKTWDLVLPRDEEPQICVQLFGSKPDQFAGAARAVSERVGSELDAIGINMACRARKVISKGGGSALLEQPDLAEEIVASCVANCDVPVTVKIRKDFKSGKLLAHEFAARMEQAGASAVAVHGRSAGQLYAGKADWSVIDAVADRVSIPVIGTGDVFTAEDAANMLDQTAASAVFIARGTYGNPWIFQDAESITAGSSLPVHSARERLAALREHVELLDSLGGHMAKARTFATWYLKGIPYAAWWRGRSVRYSTAQEFLDLADAIERDLACCEDLAIKGLAIPHDPVC